MHQDTMSLRRGRGVCESDGELSITHKIYSRYLERGNRLKNSCKNTQPHTQYSLGSRNKEGPLVLQSFFLACFNASMLQRFYCCADVVL